MHQLWPLPGSVPSRRIIPSGNACGGLRIAAANMEPGHSQVEYFLKGRRSIRVFKKDIVEPSVIERVIDSARYAPSGINRQPVRWVILHDTAKVKELARETIEWMKQLISDESPMAESLGF